MLLNDVATILSEAIAHRRTLKPDLYTGERVEDSLIQKILEAANWAPTHAYTEPWRFKVFTQEGLEVLGEFMANLDQPTKEDPSFNQMRFDRLRQRPLKSSHVIGIGMKRGDNPKIPEIEEICSVAMAVQNMWLMAHALGLGSYWSTGSMAFRPEMRHFLGLGDGDRSLGLFFIGVPSKAALPGRRLTTINDKTEWVRG